MTIADFIVIGIVVIAGMIAMGLGFVRVVLGLGGWVGAGFATLYGFEFVRPIPRQWIDSAPLADAAAGGTLFVASLIVLTLITHAIAHRVRRSGFGVLDRTLGLVAGLALGGLVVCGSFIVLERIMQWSTDSSQRPEWVRQAKSAPIIEIGAEFLVSMIPREWGGKRRSGSPGHDPARAARRLMTPPMKGAVSGDKSGYNTRERREMDRLFQSRQ